MEKPKSNLKIVADKKNVRMILPSKITEFLPSFAGLQLETEINALKKVTTEIQKPTTCIIGGSKISFIITSQFSSLIDLPILFPL